MIDSLIHFLGTQLQLDGEEISDILWLTRERQKRLKIDKLPEYKEPTRTKPPQDPPGEEKPPSNPPPKKDPEKPPESDKVPIYPCPETKSKTRTLEGYTPLAVPDPRVINHPLDLLKALKPLLLRLPSPTAVTINESATADLIAQTQLFQVITEPELEPWLELVLVVDESVSMKLWRRTIQELQIFFQHYGIFRDVRVWNLGLKDEKIYFRSSLRSHQPQELIDIQGRRLILLVSDFVDTLWYQETILQIIERWGQSNPVAALQMLPDWLWSRSALGVHTPANLLRNCEHIANCHLEARVNRLPKRRGLDRGIRLPVFSLQREEIQRWGRMLAGIGDKGALGYVLREDLLQYKPTSNSQPNPEQRVSNFMVNASPLAQKLAAMLAAAPVITMPVVRLIQRSMLDESIQIHVAEVFLGGLLCPLEEITPESDPELISYDFIEGVRAELLKSLIIPERDEVLDRVSRYVARGLGLSLRDFIGLVKNPESVEGKDGEGLIQPFAEVTREILGQLPSPTVKGFTIHTEEVEVATVKVLKGDEAALFEQISWLMDSNPISQAQLYQGMKAEMDGLSSKDPSLIIAGILQHNPNYLSVFHSETVFVDSTGQITTRQAVEASYFVVNTYALTDNQENLDSEKLEPYLIKMMVIPSGEFLMGAPASEKGSSEDERPQHKVNLSSFYMSQTPITQAQWRAIASAKNLKVNIDLELEPSHFKGDNLPVESVNWDQAVEFCQRLSNLTGLNYHLPSEAQWEYACRGFNTLGEAYPPFHFGDTLTSELANYDGTRTYADEPQGTYRRKTTPVGMFPPNTFGLYDLHGNVWEWCADDWHDNYDGAPSDGRPWLDNKQSSLTVMHGGSWGNQPVSCRSANRNFNGGRDDISNSIGFRVVGVVGRTL